MLLRTRITWLAAALVAGVVASFVIPLALLMRTMAEDRAVAETRSDAQGVAMIVASVDDPTSLPSVLAPALVSRSARTTVRLPTGQTLVGSKAASGTEDAGFPEDQGLRAQHLVVHRPRATTATDTFHVTIPVAMRDGETTDHSVTAPAPLRRGSRGRRFDTGAAQAAGRRRRGCRDRPVACRRRRPGRSLPPRRHHARRRGRHHRGRERNPVGSRCAHDSCHRSLDDRCRNDTAAGRPAGWMAWRDRFSSASA